MKMNQRIKLWLKISVVASLAALSMGNQSCNNSTSSQQEDSSVDTMSDRVLKKRIEIKHIDAQNIQAEDGSTFDFEFAANAEVYNSFYNSGLYVIPSSSQNTDSGTSVSSYDYNLYNEWRSKSSVITTLDSSPDGECLTYYPQFSIDGAINSFEVVGGGGISFGFLSGFIPSLGFTLQVAQLAMSLQAYTGLTGTMVASGAATANETKMSFNLQVSFAGFSIGPEAYFSSPLSQVTQKALNLSITRLNTGLDQKEWTTRLVDQLDKYLVVQGGSNSGLEAGDILEVYNETYYWDGTACKSNFKGSFPLTEKPIAIIQLTNVGEDLSQGKVVQLGYANPQKGALVKLHRFANSSGTADDITSADVEL